MPAACKTDPTTLNNYWFCCETLGFFMHGFGADRKSSMLGVWAAPTAGKRIPEGGARSAPSFGRAFPAAGATQTTKISVFRSAQHHASKTLASCSKITKTAEPKCTMDRPCPNRQKLGPLHTGPGYNQDPSIPGTRVLVKCSEPGDARVLEHPGPGYPTRRAPGSHPAHWVQMASSLREPGTHQVR